MVWIARDCAPYSSRDTENCRLTNLHEKFPYIWDLYLLSKLHLSSLSLRYYWPCPDGIQFFFLKGTYRSNDDWLLYSMSRYRHFYGSSLLLVSWWFSKPLEMECIAPIRLSQVLLVSIFLSDTDAWLSSLGLVISWLLRWTCFVWLLWAPSWKGMYWSNSIIGFPRESRYQHLVRLPLLLDSSVSSQSPPAAPLFSDTYWLLELCQALGYFNSLLGFSLG